MSECRAILLQPRGGIPNHPEYPLLVYPGAFPDDVSAEEIRNRFHENEWGKSWINGVFSYHHFHSNAHEVLGCFSGNATVQFGGEGGPEIEIPPGAVVVIPAGVGHRKVRSSVDFGVVGAYPPGESCDVCGDEGESADSLVCRIASVPLPPTDPVSGRDGALFDHWTG
jgi:uncharacterized protein YjlB